MSRFNLYVRAVATGYAQIAANIAYTIVSIPLALHYLDRERFGLWALLLQIVGYAQLLDLGMNVSVARTLSDHKDAKNAGTYGSILKTGAVVFTLQGASTAAIGICLASPLADVLNIPAALSNEFFWLLVAQSLLLGIGMPLRFFTAPLWCHQRQDILNLTAVAMLLVSLATLWIGLRSGLGIYALLAAQTVGFLVGQAISIPCALSLKLFPTRGHWGAASRHRFHELFSFGGNFFVMQLGVQLVSASQVIIVTRLQGLEAGAVWAVGTKIFLLAQQLTWKILDSSAPALTEMFVRGERERLRDRFRDLLVLTMVFAVIFAGCGTAFNGPFVAIWTDRKIVWPWAGDVLMGMLIVVSSITRCHTSLVGITKDIRNMRYVYFAEGICFLALALLLVPLLGLPGVILAALCANISIPGVCGLFRSAVLFGLPRIEIGLGWLRPTLFLLGIIIAADLAIFCFRPLLSQPRWLFSMASVFLAGATWLAWITALSEPIRQRIRGMMSVKAPL